MQIQPFGSRLKLTNSSPESFFKTEKRYHGDKKSDFRTQAAACSGIFTIFFAISLACFALYLATTFGVIPNHVLA